MTERYAARLRTDHVLVVTGDLVDGTEGQLDQDIRTHSGDLTRDLTVDLSGATFFPSTAVSVVASALKEAGRHGTDLRLQAQDTSIAARVLHVCGIEYVPAP